MLRIFDSQGRELFSRVPPKPDEDGIEPCWYDLQTPTADEEKLVEAAIGTNIPSHEDLRDIEPSSRLYTEGGAVYLTASLPFKTDTPFPELTDVGFIFANGRLVTIRYAEPRAFGIFSANLVRTRDAKGAHDILTRLIEAIVDRTAEILEHATRNADGISARVFRPDPETQPDRATRDLEATLVEIAQMQRLVAKARESLMSFSRVAGFLQTRPEIHGDRQLKDRCRSIARDIQSLSEHADFISGNIIFLLDACLGLISVQQNTIIKIFSIAAVVLLPPTFIATIYGMNFRHMPELDLLYAYPVALGAMILAGVLPYLWFRRKGWM